ncbi:MAG TPA: hypothetical protein DDW81_17110 [Cryomorphaceae bacterium]|nr:hypothetical protein [Owenweeksia sp.]HBF21822.1 hypothetical protein [Cryomorphaceae bacterium]|tara:strand:+ start:3905 stop:5848 length:1944 start_codon:yes stop_codon:yes gene_type:complete
MRYLILPYVLFIAYATAYTPIPPPVMDTNTPLLLICQNDRYGYINPQGQIVIEPHFLNAGEFSEDLAPARINGLFGYINPRGEWAIPPQYEFAEPFREGVAVIYTNGKPFYIDRTGHIIFEHNFISLGPFKNGRAMVITKNNRKGIIQKDGSLLVDTLYDDINPLVNEYYQLFINGDSTNEGVDATGVVDSTGKFTIPMGRFSSLQYHGNSFLKFKDHVEKPDDTDPATFSGFVDINGEILFRKKFGEHQWLHGGLFEGFVVVYLNSSEEDTPKNKRETAYQGYINTKGDIVIDKPEYRYVTSFSNGRAFARVNGKNYLIDTTGKITHPRPYSLVQTFMNGHSIVLDSGNRNWGVINTSGQYIIEPSFIGITHLDEHHFYFSDTTFNPKCESCYGVANYKGETIIEPSLNDLDYEGFKNGLLHCIKNGYPAYIDTSGKVIWQEEETSITELQSLNIDYMNGGYFIAFSEQPNSHGGYAESQNLPQKIDKALQLPEKELSVTVKTEVHDTLWKSYLGYRVIVANTTRKKIEFFAQDSRLYMKVQAKNPRGEWQDIEYLPSSWCGNSYHSVYLKKNEYWKLTTPVYEGDFETQLRIELEYPDPDDEPENPWERKTRKIYSNEYAGSVNLAQFWRKPGYSPSGIMDPYND